MDSNLRGQCITLSRIGALTKSFALILLKSYPDCQQQRRGPETAMRRNRSSARLGASASQGMDWRGSFRTRKSNTTLPHVRVPSLLRSCPLILIRSGRALKKQVEDIELVQRQHVLKRSIEATDITQQISAMKDTLNDAINRFQVCASLLSWLLDPDWLCSL